MGYIITAGLAAVIILLIIVIIGLKHHSNKTEGDKLHSETNYQLEISKLKDQLHAQDLEQLESDGLKNRIVELSSVIAVKEEQIENYSKQINDYNDRVLQLAIACSSLDNKYAESNDELNELQETRIKLLTEQKSLDEAIIDAKTAVEKLSLETKTLRKELDDLKERKRLAILNQDKQKDGYGELVVNKQENELILILERIKKDYPELTMDISSIEWRKIGLPKIQDLCNEKCLNKTGIYRLILKENEDICYVGQAQSIKDRGYQHIKKMIGVDAKGNEKLYNYKPDDFYGTIVEYNPKDINESEHYGIEYFGCKERGLNRKA